MTSELTMQPIARLLIILAILILLPALSQAYRARVVWVTDGDTLTVWKNGWALETIRIYGLDCPERNQPYGLKATVFSLSRLIFREVEVQPVERDRYGRLVARLSRGGRSVNQEILQAGYAWVYDRYCRKDVCARYRLLEEEARKDGRGLWGAEDPLPPWRWRQGKRPDSGWRFW
jgi:endonuclease YncB( thermonuclease family)